MKNGIWFIWVDKEVMANIMNFMEEQGFTYIENFSIINFSLNTSLKKIKELKEAKKTQKKKPAGNNLMNYFKKLPSNESPETNNDNAVQPDQKETSEELVEQNLNRKLAITILTLNSKTECRQFG